MVDGLETKRNLNYAGRENGTAEECITDCAVSHASLFSDLGLYLHENPQDDPAPAESPRKHRLWGTVVFGSKESLIEEKRNPSGD